MADFKSRLARFKRDAKQFLQGGPKGYVDLGTGGDFHSPLLADDNSDSNGKM